MNEKRKVTENFRFKFDNKSKTNAVFALEENRDEYVILLRIEKALMGDQHDPIEAYQKDVPEIKREKIKHYMKSNETMLCKVIFSYQRRGNCLQ
jgi:hypothetical protein